MTLKIKSDFARLDVKAGREKLLKTVEQGAVPVTIEGLIVGRWSKDDGTSIEFEVQVKSVSLGAGK